LQETAISHTPSATKTATENPKNQYTPPANFEEFLERYPNLVRRYLKARWWPGYDLIDDLVQDVYVHLMALPVDSSLRSQGHSDRISTFNAELGYGLSETSFVRYVKMLIDRYVWKHHRHNRNRLVARSVSLSKPVALGGELVHRSPDDVLALHGFFSRPNALLKTEAEQLLAAALKIDPKLANVVTALLNFRTQVKAAAALGIPLKHFQYRLARLRKLGEAHRSTPRRKPVPDELRERILGHVAEAEHAFGQALAMLEHGYTPRHVVYRELWSEGIQARDMAVELCRANGIPLAAR
jgi:hypothetical protein